MDSQPKPPFCPEIQPSCLHLHIEEGEHKTPLEREHEAQLARMKIYIAVAAVCSGCCTSLITTIVGLIIHFTNCKK